MLNKALTAIILSVPLLAQTVSAGPCVRSYVVRENDICDSISAANHVSTYQLAVINNGVINSRCTNLVPGSTICLGYQGEDCDTTYVVKRGDTCGAIQNAYNINSTILYMNNPQINEECDNIYIGEVLCVAPRVIVPPAPAGYTPPAAVIPATATPAHPTSTPVQNVAPGAGGAPAPPPPPAPTPAPSSAPSSAPVPVPEQGIEVGDEDDEDLPYCDEL